MSKPAISRLCLLMAVCTALSLQLLGATASAAPAPHWRLDSLSQTSAGQGDTFRYVVQYTNVGDGPTSAAVDPWKFTATIPAGLKVQAVTDVFGEFEVIPPWSCSVSEAGDTSIECENTSASLPKLSNESVGTFWIDVEVEASAQVPPEKLTSRFSISGGGSSPAGMADPLTVAPEAPEFGIDAFDETALDAGGAPATQAAGRPAEVKTSIDFNSVPNPAPLKGTPWPVEPVKDIVVDLPPGSLGSTAEVPQCSLLALTSDKVTVKSRCPLESQVGESIIRINWGGYGVIQGPVPVYNMVPPPDGPARLGFNVYGTIVTIEARVRSEDDYGLSASLSDINEGLAFTGSELTLWGVPADSSHDYARTCPVGTHVGGEGDGDSPWQGGSNCASPAPETGFWRNPTSCEAEETGLTTSVRADSWFDPGDFDERTIHSHLLPGYGLPESEWGAPQGPTGCSKVRFEPSIEATPTTNAADSPSGLDFHVRVPQDCWTQKEGLCQSDLRDAEVTLPQGMTLNPSAAAGLGSCTPGQVGLTTPVGSSSPIHFDSEPAECPDSSKIGTVRIETPLLGRHDPESGQPIVDADGNALPEPLTGSVYLAQQVQNPFGSVLAMYLVAEGAGVVVKQAGEIRMGPGGRMTTVFKDAPQTPFSDLHVELFGGSRAPLRTPPACGTFAVTARLTPWSGNGAVTRASGFEIDSCPNSGFDPKLTAGTDNPLAGETSPFNLRLQREDGTEELAGLELALPPGLSGYLKGISYCPDSVLAAVSGDLGTGAAQEASPSCPAASQVGRVTVGAGAGPTPFYTSSGRAYLAGPYKGAPASLAVVAPAVAGPFDLGSVVVRNAIQVDPQTAQLTVVSDPLPTALHGIPLDLRDVRVAIDRDHFTLNPTSCDEMQIGSRIVSAQGATASPSQRFQLAGCERLGFKPRLSLRLKGGTRRSENPALIAVMRPRLGNANASRIQVALPRSEFLAEDHLDTICTRVRFAANDCPKGSIYGRVSATSPILDYPLTGNVYLRSSNHLLPDLVLALRGPASQPIEIDAAGRIDTDEHGGIRTTFSVVPDAPLTRVVLRMQGGQKSLLDNHINICRGKHRATVQMDAHNGKIHDFRPAVRVDCGGGKRQRG